MGILISHQNWTKSPWESLAGLKTQRQNACKLLHQELAEVQLLDLSLVPPAGKSWVQGIGYLLSDHLAGALGLQCDI